MTVFAGDTVMADETNEALKTGTIIARGRRITSSTASASETSVLRVDAVPVVSGHVYMLMTNPVAIDTTVANDTGRINLRVDETGAAATTGSTLVCSAQAKLPDITNAECHAVMSTRTATSTGTWSVLLTTSRATGTGNISLIGTAQFPIELLVIDCGVDPGDTGVDL